MFRTFLLLLFFISICSIGTNGSPDASSKRSRVQRLKDSLLNQGVDTMLIYEVDFSSSGVTSTEPVYLLWQKSGQTNCIVTDNLNARENKKSNPIIFSNYFKVKHLIEADTLKYSGENGPDHVVLQILTFIVNKNSQKYIVPFPDKSSAIGNYTQIIDSLLNP